MSKIAAVSHQKMHPLDEALHELLGDGLKAFPEAANGLQFIDRTLRYNFESGTFDVKFQFNGEEAIALDADRESRVCGLALLRAGQKPKSLGFHPKPMALESWLRRARL